MSEESFRLRIRYTKEGRLRYLSHLEVVRCLERCIRRAGLPFAVSQGFSPHMKTAFGWALPVGVASVDEYLDVWLTQYIAAEKIVDAFEGTLPFGMRVLDAWYVGAHDKSLTEELCCAKYDCTFSTESMDVDEFLQQLQSALDLLLQKGEMTIIKKGKEKVISISPLLHSIPQLGIGDDGLVHLELSTFTEGKGSLRCDLFCAELLSAIDARIVSMTRVLQFACQ